MFPGNFQTHVVSLDILIYSFTLFSDDYWSNHPELHDIPIYYASSLAKKCMAVYQTYSNAMNQKIQKQLNVSNPFQFKHISNLKVCKRIIFELLIACSMIYFKLF